MISCATNEIHCDKLENALKNSDGRRVIDVRTPGEYEEVHIEGTQNIPLNELNGFCEQNIPMKGDVILVCKTGSRAKAAAKKLTNRGWSAMVLTDGIDNWINSGRGVVYGKKSMSLERQVRIAAGMLIFASTMLAHLNFYFIYLAMFAGAGLIFAGVTNTCGMAIMLSAMPWNRKKPVA